MQRIKPVASGFDVKPLVAALADPGLWDRIRFRKEAYEHSQMSDIWVRYNDIKNLGEHFNDEHESVWYPIYHEIQEFRPLVFDVMGLVFGERLGGVLVTKIPPGQEVRPHVDFGWHARYYEKFALQLQGHEAQSFNFEGEKLVPKTGDLYTFNNSFQHWVVNDSPIDRITMIICIKRDPSNVMHRV